MSGNKFDAGKIVYEPGMAFISDFFTVPRENGHIPLAALPYVRCHAIFLTGTATDAFFFKTKFFV